MEVVLGASDGAQVARAGRARSFACACALIAASCAPERGVEPEVVCRVWAPPARGDGELMVGGTGAALGLMEALGEGWAGGSGGGAGVRVPASLGSGGGLRALRDGVLDVAVVGRPLTGQERGWGLESVVVARTPVVFVSRYGAELGVSGLEQAYGARASEWPDGRPMVTLGREASDTALGEIGRVYGPLGRAIREGAAVVSYTDQQMLEAIERVEGAVGFVDLGALRLSGGSARAMRLEGVAPGSPAYPLWREVRLAWRPGGSAVAEAFVAHAQAQLGSGRWVDRGYHAP